MAQEAKKNVFMFTRRVREREGPILSMQTETTFAAKRPLFRDNAYFSTVITPLSILPLSLKTNQ